MGEKQNQLMGMSGIVLVMCVEKYGAVINSDGTVGVNYGAML